MNVRTIQWKMRGPLALGALWLVLGGALPVSAGPARGESDERAIERQQAKVCESFLHDFKSANPLVADRAYSRLYAAGKQCIGQLLDLGGDLSTYAGAGFQDPASCDVAMSAVAVGKVALYLVDGILMGSPTPHYSTVLLSRTGEPGDVLLDRTLTLYQDWWTEHQGDSLAKLRRATHPLAGSDIHWHGLTHGGAALGTVVISDTPVTKTNGKPVPGSGTPIADPPTCIAQQDPNSWIFPPGTPGGPTPYNCMAWAVHCYTDRWMQPNPDVPNSGWMDILKNNGYDPGSTIDCVTQSCANGGTKVKLVWEVGPGETPNDDNWVHAMKQEAGQDWSSKNGQTELYTGITDCMKFVNDHYPAAPGNSLVIRCYCPTSVK
jgi:hypothetical protein